MSKNSSAARHLTAVESDEPVSPASSEQGRINLYAEQTEVCSFCFGTGMEVVAGRGARRCRCRTEDRRAKLFEASRIPRRYSECSLEGYKPAKGNGSQLLAFNYAYRLVHDYPAVDRGLLFMGSVGVGKLHPRNYPCRTQSCAMRDHQGY